MRTKASTLIGLSKEEVEAGKGAGVTKEDSQTMTKIRVSNRINHSSSCLPIIVAQSLVPKSMHKLTQLKYGKKFWISLAR